MESFIGKIKDADLYIGQNAGKRIKNLLEKAEKSIKIVSPYIAEDMVELLVSKKSDGVDVELLTSDDNRHFSNPEKSQILKNIIRQNRSENSRNMNLRDKLLLSVGVILMLITGTIFICSYFGIFQELFSFPHMLKIIIPTTLIVYILLNIRKKMRVYNYSYETSFPVTFVVDPMNMSEEERGDNKGNAFFHVKLFIIDEKIAFLGSVNLTKKGMKYNVESCITVRNREEIQGLIQYFNSIYDKKYYVMDLDYYGRLLYPEPIN